MRTHSLGKVSTFRLQQPFNGPTIQYTQNRGPVRPSGATKTGILKGMANGIMVVPNADGSADVQLPPAQPQQTSLPWYGWAAIAGALYLLMQ